LGSGKSAPSSRGCSFLLGGRPLLQAPPMPAKRSGLEHSKASSGARRKYHLDMAGTNVHPPQTSESLGKTIAQHP
jgi:hypothetical protein